MASFQDQVNAWAKPGTSNTWLNDPAALKCALTVFGLSHLAASPKLAGVTTISELHGKLKVRTALTRVHNRY